MFTKSETAGACGTQNSTDHDVKLYQHNAGNAVQSGAIERSTASQEVLRQLDIAISRLMRVSDNAEGLADRLMGGYPENSKAEQKPYPSGLLGDIARRLDQLDNVISVVDTHVDRLQRLA